MAEGPQGEITRHKFTECRSRQVTESEPRIVAVQSTHGICIDPNEPEWVREYAIKEKRNRLLRDRTDLEEQLKKIREKELKEKQSLERGEQKPKRQVWQYKL